MGYYRQAVVNLLISWEGKKESNGTYRSVIDTYNSYKGPMPRDLKMDYSWPWCACTWSAAAVALNYTDIMPIEISCTRLIDLAKAMGIWQENDSYIPSPGDGIIYDWQDNGVGDNKGAPDHIGTVISVNKASGYFVVMEGNYNDSIKRRTVSINGRYIRGFICPRYTENDAPNIVPTVGGKSIDTIAHEVIDGTWGNQPERQKRLEALGYKYADVQSRVNEILNIPKAPVTKVVVASCKPQVSGSQMATYKVTAETYLHLRNDAGTNKKSLYKIPGGTLVTTDGSYTMFNGSKWLYITVKGTDGVTYTGFSHTQYLKKEG